MFLQFASESGVSENSNAFPYPFLGWILATQLTSTHSVASRGHFLFVGHCGNCLLTMKVKNYGLEVLSHAVSMPQAGMTQRDVALHVGVPVLTIKRWWKKFNNEGSVANRPRSGRTSTISTVVKIMMEKAAGKSCQSARKLTKWLTQKSHQVSEGAVLRYWTDILGLKAYKIRVRPKLTEKQEAHRLRFCQERKDWTVEEWK